MAETINTQPNTDGLLVDGQSRLLFMNTGVDPDIFWKPVICQTDGTFNKSRDVSDAASKCNPSGKYSGVLTLTKDVTVQNIEGITKGAAIVVADMNVLLVSKDIKEFMIQDESPKKGAIRSIFKAQVTQVNETDPMNNYSSASVTLTVYGEVDYYENTGTVDAPVWIEYTPNF